MPTSLRILMLEDSAEDAALAIAELEGADYRCLWNRVETGEDFLAHLDAADFDLVLADYHLPSFNGLAALKLFIEKEMVVPFILLSGAVGEETATEALKSGATDYVLKQNLSRLPLVVGRALREKHEHKQRRQTEEALRAAEARYRDLFNYANDIIYVHDLDGRFISINKTGECLTGYTGEEVLSLSISDIVAPEHIEAQRRSVDEKIAGSREASIYEIDIICKDGSRLPVEVSSRLIVEAGNPVAIQGIARDISERKRLEEQLRQSQKMEAVGRLAGGIAHDFNNLLTAMMGYSQLSLNRLDDNDPMRSDISEIEKAAKRAAMLTRQLLAFSRKQVMQPRAMSLNATVAEFEPMLKRLIGEDITLITHLDEALGQVTADPGQIEQIIMNLAVNARDAMPEGGKLTIETANVSLDDEYVRRRVTAKSGHYVMLAVSDTGTGIDKETQSLIFEPFFTTKEKGKGTGLGLSTVYGIVKQSGGDICVYSEPGIGTTFKIYLPREDKSEQGDSERAPLIESLSGTETILLVEDEEIVRNLARAILRMNGYTVLDARSASEAVEIFEHYRKGIHLVITDVVMPDLGGPVLVGIIKQEEPDMKVLYMSGYPDNAVIHSGLLSASMNYIQKPFSPEALAHKVREVLGPACPDAT